MTMARSACLPVGYRECKDELRGFRDAGDGIEMCLAQSADAHNRQDEAKDYGEEIEGDGNVRAER